MQLRSLGHAGIEIRANGSRILCDPWFSPEGAFQASWFQYPDNSFLIDDELLSPTAIFISHEHMDHVDPWFLERVPAEIPVYIPRYASRVLPNKVLSARHRPLVELEQWEFEEVVPGVKLMFVSEESPMNHDSVMVVTADGKSLLNMNDARLSAAQIRGIKNEVGGTIDVLALQGAGASWFPMCYEYPQERMAELAVQKRIAKLRYVARNGASGQARSLPALCGSSDFSRRRAPRVQRASSDPKGSSPISARSSTGSRPKGWNRSSSSPVTPGTSQPASATERNRRRLLRRPHLHRSLRRASGGGN